MAEPFLATIAGADANPMTLFDMSNLWLGPLQGLVAAVIGAMFFSKSTKAGQLADQGAGTNAGEDEPGGAAPT